MKATKLVTILSMLMLALAPIAHGETEATPAPIPSELVKIGEIGRLRLPSDPKLPVPVGVTQEAFEEFIKSAVIDDNEGTVELLTAGKLMPIKQGTKVRKLDIHGFLGQGPDEVRILEGEFKGKKGFVSSDWIVPAS